MKQVIYNGPDTSLGQHGKVKAGQKLLLDYEEWMSVRGNPMFVPVSQPGAVKEERILPCGAPGYDLRVLPWGESKIVNILKSRNLATIKKIVAAMNHLGIKVEATVHDTSKVWISAILFAADEAGWMD